MTGARIRWGRWATLALGCLALFGGQLVALATLVWWQNLSLPHWSDLAVDGRLVTLTVYIGTTIQVLVLVLLASRTAGGFVHYLGLTLPRVRDLVQGFIAIAVFMLIADLIGKTFGHEDVTQFQLDIYRTAREIGWVGLLCVALVVVGPIGEETLFRGFLFSGWYRSPADTWPVIIITAFLWAIVHAQYDFYLIVQIFIYGLVLGWMRWKSGSTILTMLLHGVVNLGGVIETLLAIRT